MYIHGIYREQPNRDLYKQNPLYTFPNFKTPSARSITTPHRCASREKTIKPHIQSVTSKFPRPIPETAAHLKKNMFSPREIIKNKKIDNFPAPSRFSRPRSRKAIRAREPCPIPKSARTNKTYLLTFRSREDFASQFSFDTLIDEFAGKSARFSRKG